MHYLFKTGVIVFCIVILSVGSLIGVGLAIADETVKTIDGRKILLKSDGTYQIIVKPKAKASDTLITSVSGKGIKNTRPFTTKGPWEIQWDAQGDIFQIYLYTAEGDMAGVPANQQGPGKGASYQPKAGKYFLKVNAMGSWKVDIVHVQ